MSTIIANDTKSALQVASTAHHITQFKVYCDGSRYKGSAGAAAILYNGNTAVKSLYLHISSANEHTVYETELVRIILTLHLLALLMHLITSTIIIGLDNQATIESLNNQKPKPTHNLLDQIHMAAKLLNSKQDHIKCRNEFRIASSNGHHPVIRTRGVWDLRIHWVPGHHGFLPNEWVDALAKRVAKGNSSPVKDLPAFLRKATPMSIAALHQENKSKIQHIWKRCWKGSPRRKLTDKIDKSTPSKKWMNLTKPLTHKQASILMQLQTGHVGLNKYLHHIKRATSPKCSNCNENTDETVSHFLLVCT